jgi:N-acetyl-1-D-myo-inositol-2-amino-2-deoxy-alpha-D-glucopyranoside deacetylase
VPDGDLGTVRARELDDAANVLGIAEVIMCDQPDGDLRWARIHDLNVRIVNAVRRCRPDVVITFAEDGLYWHLDHIGVHERTRTALESLGAQAPPLYYVTMPPLVMREVVETAIARGWVPSDSSFWGIAPEAFGDAAETPTLTVDVRDWVPRKLAALRCHRTQMASSNPFARIEPAEARRWLGVEHFRRAIGSPAAPVLESIGESVASS